MHSSVCFVISLDASFRLFILVRRLCDGSSRSVCLFVFCVSAGYLVGFRQNVTGSGADRS